MATTPPNAGAVMKAVTQQAAPAPVPDETKYAEAEQFLNNQLFWPAYFRKLAELGMEPATDAEAGRLFQIGDMVRQARQLHQRQQTQVNVNQLDKVAADLGQKLQQQYGIQPARTATGDRLHKEAAAVAEHPLMLQATQAVYETLARQAA